MDEDGGVALETKQKNDHGLRQVTNLGAAGSAGSREPGFTVAGSGV